MSNTPQKRCRKILHLDLDAFFCAVEELLDPGLKGKAFAVGGSADRRGVVSSCSYAARMYGVHSAMPMARALQVCPQLITVSSGYGNYSHYSRKVMDILNDLTPLVEQISIDEAFLDVTDLPQSGYEIALLIQKRIDNELSLPCSIGVAANKLMAKIANNQGKARHKGPDYPRAIEVVPPGKEAEYLAPLPVKDLWGIGPKSAEKLNQMGIKTVGDLAALNKEQLINRFGKMGVGLYRQARGIDERELDLSHDVKSISHETTFGKDVSDLKTINDKFRKLAESVGKRLRQKKLCGTTVRIKVRWPDFTTLSRQMTFTEPLDQDRVIYEAGWQLFLQVWQTGKAVRLIGIGVSGLKEHVFQLNLWDTESTRERRLNQAVDEIKQRFGDDALQRGVEINRSKRNQ